MARTSRVRRQIVVENKEVTERNVFNIVNFVNFVKFPSNFFRALLALFRALFATFPLPGIFPL